MIWAIAGKLSTLLARLTSGRASNLDNLDAAVSTRAAASTALSSTTWDGTKAGYLDAAITSRLGNIKAIYAGSINVSITSFSASNTATITAVNTAKTIILFLGHYSGAASDTTSNARVELTNSTTVTAYAFHAPSGTATITVGYMVVEFN
jgi:hypothetical protein